MRDSFLVCHPELREGSIKRSNDQDDSLETSTLHPLTTLCHCPSMRPFATLRTTQDRPFDTLIHCISYSRQARGNLLLCTITRLMTHQNHPMINHRAIKRRPRWGLGFVCHCELSLSGHEVVVEGERGNLLISIITRPFDFHLGGVYAERSEVLDVRSGQA